MTAIAVINLRVRDLPGIQQYATDVAALLVRHGGEIIARSASKVEVVEGEWRPALVFVERWPSKQAFREFYASADYQPLKELRQLSADTEIVIFDEP